MQCDPENKLEKLLTLALEAPAHRPEFYHVLLESTVYVISQADLPGSDKLFFKPSEILSILQIPTTEKIMVILFFSSLDRLIQFINHDAEWKAINARELFMLTKGMTLLLNPNSQISKGFSPSEIDALLKTGVHHGCRPGTAPSQSRAPIGPPEPYPAGTIDALTNFFSTCPQVRAAYAAMAQDPNESPHLVLGIDADADTDMLSIIRRAAAVTADTAPAPYSSLVAVYMKHSGDDTAASLLRCGICFYDRSWGARLSTTAGRA